MAASAAALSRLARQTHRRRSRLEWARPLLALCPASAGCTRGLWGRFESPLKSSTREPQPPRLAKIPWSTSVHGRIRNDEYRWLQDAKHEPAMLQHVDAENRFTDRVLSRTEVFQTRQGMAELLQPAVECRELSSRVASYNYYTKHDDGEPVYCRAPCADGDSRINEEILVHPTRDLPMDCSSDRVQKVCVSADERKVAFMTPRMWTELGDVWVKELVPGLGGTAKKAIDSAFNFTWAADNTTLYYTRADDALRPYQVFIHRLGYPSCDDIQIYQESNPEAFVDVGVTKDKRFVTISSNTLDSSEVLVIDAQHDFGELSGLPQLPKLRVIRPREDGVEYYVNHHENKFFIVTNIAAPDFKVVTADSPEGRNWVDLIPPDPILRIEDADIFKVTTKYHRNAS